MDTPYKIDDEFITKFGDWIRKRAKGMKDNAGYNGDHHDGGASRLNAAWDCYVAGYTRKDFPYNSYGTTTYVDEYLREHDSEYAEFLRLKKKFED